MILSKEDTIRLKGYDLLFKRYETSNLDSAIYYARQGLEYFNRQTYPKGRIVMMIYLAGCYSIRGQLEEARQLNEEALLISTRTNDLRGIGAANNALGVLEAKRGDYPTAIRHFLYTLKIYRDTENRQGLASTYLKLGAVNEMIGQYDKALLYYHDALDLLESSGESSPNIPYLYNNIGTVHSRSGNFTPALSAFQKALQTSDHPRFSNIRILPLTNLGLIYEKQGDPTRALRYFRQALELCEKENLPENRARLLLNISPILSPSRPAEAERMLLEALNIARNMEEKVLEGEALDALIRFYTGSGDYKKAYNNQLQAEQLKDSLFSLQKEKEIAQLQAIHELASLEGKVASMEATSGKIVQDKNTLLFLGGIAFLCIAGLAGSLLYVHTRNKILKKEKERLRRSQTLKDQLFSTLGDEIHSSLTSTAEMIDLYRAPKIPEKEKNFIVETISDNITATIETLEDLISWGQSKMRGIAAQPSCFSVPDAIESVLNQLQPGASQKQITLLQLIPQGMMIEADMQHFRFIIRNLLSNAIKNTRSNGTIELNALADGSGQVVFSIKDNGVGLDAEKLKNIFVPGTSPRKKTKNESNLGLLLCKELIEESGGRLWVESQRGKGSVFYFTAKHYQPYYSRKTAD